MINMLTEHAPQIYLAITAALTLVWAALLGITRGMVMATPRDVRQYSGSWDIGIRSHVWFKYYHMKFAQTLFRALPVSIGYLLAHLDWTLSTVLFLAGIVILGWQLFESFYSWSRWATWLPESENLMGKWGIHQIFNIVLLRVSMASSLITWSFIL